MFEMRRCYWFGSAIEEKPAAPRAYVRTGEQRRSLDGRRQDEQDILGGTQAEAQFMHALFIIPMS